MPANTSPDNIEYPVSTDPVAPLETVFANMANSVQDAFDGFRTDWNDFEDNRAIQTFRWADATERAAQTGMQAGDVGYQVDTATDYIYTGSAWRVNTGGAVFLKSDSFSGSSSIIIDGIGSAAFRDIIIELDVSAASASHTLAANLRSAGSTNTASVYDRQLVFGADSTTTSFKANNATEWGIGATASRNIRRVTISLSRLADAVATLGRIEYEEFDATTGAAEITTGIRHKTASAFDGIIITPSSGTITGTYTVRGTPR